jgi:putative transposase
VPAAPKALRFRHRVGTMARPLRIQWPGALYHVTARAGVGRFAFRDLTSRQTFLALLEKAIRDCEWKCHAYCLMTTHFHLVLETPLPNLAAGMQYVNGVYARFANHRFGERGHLFESRYRSKIIASDEHLKEVWRYVALYPVRADRCAAPEEWEWSSYAATIGLAPAPRFLTTELVLGHFSDDVADARRLLREFVEDGIDAARSAA